MTPLPSLPLTPSSFACSSRPGFTPLDFPNLLPNRFGDLIRQGMELVGRDEKICIQNERGWNEAFS